ncbi:hypothetical protein HanIR_Chr10g0458811 [Helianthus annuus]|nr:hypothetical protein HanIR_Chr10g0458811 [Helianthus annuus]
MQTYFYNLFYEGRVCQKESDYHTTQRRQWNNCLCCQRRKDLARSLGAKKTRAFLSKAP